MKVFFFALMISFGFNVAQAYTLNLPENAVFANKHCKLAVGKKSRRAADFNRHIEKALVQPATLVTAQNKSYSFELADNALDESQTNFGQVLDQTFSTTVHIKKISEEAIQLNLIMEDWHGRTDYAEKCGVMVLQ
jgi:hypothetical protein